MQAISDEKETQRLKAIYEERSTEELTELWEKDGESLTPSAISALTDVLGARGVNTGELRELDNPVPLPDPRSLGSIPSPGVGRRLVHMVIDFWIMGYAVSYAMAYLGIQAGVIKTETQAIILGFASVFVFQTFMEFGLNKSVGKLITRTRVITDQGQSPGFGACLLRTLSRLVPFEPFSVLSSDTRMWHDKWSQTRVVADTELRAWRERVTAIKSE